MKLNEIARMKKLAGIKLNESEQLPPPPSEIKVDPSILEKDENDLGDSSKNEEWICIGIRYRYGDTRCINYKRNKKIDTLIDTTIQKSMQIIENSTLDDIAINYKKVIDSAQKKGYSTKTRQGRIYDVYPFYAANKEIAMSDNNPLRMLDTMVNKYVTDYVIRTIGIHQDDVVELGINIVYNIFEDTVYFMTKKKHIPITDKASIYNAIDQM